MLCCELCLLSVSIVLCVLCIVVTWRLPWRRLTQTHWLTDRTCDFVTLCDLWLVKLKLSVEWICFNFSFSASCSSWESCKPKLQAEAYLSSAHPQPRANHLQKQQWQEMAQDQHGAEHRLPEEEELEDVVEAPKAAAEAPGLVILQLLPSRSMLSQSHPLQDVLQWSDSMTWRETWSFASNLALMFWRRRKRPHWTYWLLDWTDLTGLQTSVQCSEYSNDLNIVCSVLNFT